MNKLNCEVKSALIDLAKAVEKIDLVCEELIDCNDWRLIEARHYLNTANVSIEEIKNICARGQHND